MEPMDAVISSSEFFPTSSPAVAGEAMRKEISALGLRIIELESNLQSATSNLDYQRNAASVARSQIRSFQDALTEAVECEDIDMDLAAAFADIFGFTLTKPVELVVSVTFRGTAQIPLNQDIDSIDWTNELSASIDSYHSEIEFDLYEDDMDVEVS